MFPCFDDIDEICIGLVNAFDDADVSTLNNNIDLGKE